MEEETKSQEKVRTERRKGITINLEIQKKPHGYPRDARGWTTNGKVYKGGRTYVLDVPLDRVPRFTRK